MSAEDGSCGHDACGCNSGPDTPEEAGSALLDRLDNDDGFHPMGDDWEEDMREMLDDTEYDSELGMDMARDAMRLVAGEMEEEDFYDQYHDAVVDEFEVDDRPMAELFEEEDDASVVDSLKDLAEGDVSRRDTMKKMAFGAGAVGLGGMLPQRDEHDHGSDGDDGSTSGSGTVAAQPDEEGAQYGMVIDLDRCDGCLECVIGCMDENRTTTGANWMYVLTWEDETTEQENFLVRPCQHCSNAPCAKVCPVSARHRRSEDGLVLTNYETCIGCRYCQVACPYGVNYFEWGEPDVPRDDISMVEDYDGSDLRGMSAEERADILQESGDHVHDHRGVEVDSRPRKGTMGKCTFCPSRQDGNMGDDMVGTVACMDACDQAGMSAIHFGRMDIEDSRPNRYLEQRAETEPSPEEKQEQLEDPEDEWQDPENPHGTSQLSAFRLMEEMGTEPNVVYLGNEPGPTAEQVDPEDAPVDYNADFVESRIDGRPIVDRRKDVTDAWTDLGALEESG